MILYRIDFFYDQQTSTPLFGNVFTAGGHVITAKNNSMDGAGDSQENMISSGSINMGDDDTEDWEGTAKR